MGGINYDSSPKEFRQVLIELDKGLEEEERLKLEDRLTNDSIVKFTVSRYVTAEDALMTLEVDEGLRKKLQRNNPLSDHYILNDLSEFDLQQINDYLTTLADETNIKSAKIVNYGSKAGSMRSMNIVFQPLAYLFIAITMLIVFIGLSMDFDRNRNNLLKLLAGGKDRGKLKSEYFSKGFQLSFKSWIIAVFLAIALIYLIKLIFGTQILQFGVLKALMIALGSLALISFTILWTISSKISALKTAENG